MPQAPPSALPQQIASLLERAGLAPIPAQRDEITNAYARLAVLIERLRAFDLEPGDEPLPTYRPLLERDR
jgi:hypothetical protein